MVITEPTPKGREKRKGERGKRKVRRGKNNWDRMSGTSPFECSMDRKKEKGFLFPLPPSLHVRLRQEHDGREMTASSLNAAT